MAAGVVIINEIDSPDKRDLPVDQCQFAVKSAQPVAPEPEWRPFGAIDNRRHARACKPWQELGGKRRRSETIDEDPYWESASRGVDQRIGNGVSARVVLEEVGFDVDVALRRADGFDQCREKLGAASEKRQVIRGKKLERHPPDEVQRNEADSAAWSEIRDHGMPE